MSDERYAYGKQCTWHGPATFASLVANGGENEFVCPKCGMPLVVMAVSEFWADGSRAGEETKAVMRWSEGKCFPDADTVWNAYRQAMAGEQ